MDQDLNSILHSKEGERLMEKREELSHIVSSRAGQAAFRSLQASGAEDAVERGDMDALRAAIENMVKTDAGKKLMAELQDLVNGQ